jgi:hypothetical protein
MTPPGTGDWLLGQVIWLLGQVIWLLGQVIELAVPDPGDERG